MKKHFEQHEYDIIMSIIHSIFVELFEDQTSIIGMITHANVQSWILEGRNTDL